MSDRKFTLLYRRTIKKELKRLSPTIRVAIVAKITRLQYEPRPSGYEKLKGSTDLFRIRHGSYRIIYEIRQMEVVIVVVKVGHRREVYRLKG